MTKRKKALWTFRLKGLPPSVNESYSLTKTRMYKKTSVKRWQKEVVQAIKETIEKETEKSFPLKECLSLSLTIYTADRRRMDIDNRVKAVQDCLQTAGVIKDDSQVWILNVRRVLLKIKAGKKPKTEDEYTRLRLKGLA